jgi:hypothetical protein
VSDRARGTLTGNIPVDVPLVARDLENGYDTVTPLRLV